MEIGDGRPGKIFKALQGREYRVSMIEDIDSSAYPCTPTPIPAYLGSDGKLFDVNYLELKGSDRSIDILAQVNGIDPSVFSSMPLPDQNFDNFLDYEKALLKWKIAIEDTLRFLQLPNVMGRHYYRPRVTTERSRGNTSPAEWLDAGVNLMNNKVVSIPNQIALPNTNRSDPESIEKKAEEDEEVDDLFKRIHTGSMSKSHFSQLWSFKKKQEECPSPSVSEVTKSSRTIPTPIEDDRKALLYPDIFDPLKVLQYEKEPWDSVLVPQEPDPSLYETYEDYECSMKRWAALCMNLPIIPPHAKQLKDLIPIQKVENECPSVDTGGKSVSRANEMENTIIPMKLEMTLKEIPFFQTFTLPWTEPKVQITKLATEGNTLLSKEARNHILSLLDTMIKNRQQKKGPQLLPVIHGTFPKPWDRSGGTGSTGGTGIRIRAGKNKALRRTDLTGAMISACMDCPSEIDGKRVEFRIPDFDIDVIDIGKLRDPNDTKYIEKCRLSIRQIQYGDRNDYLNSWYYPAMAKETSLKSREKLDFIMKSIRLDKMEILHLEKIFSTGIATDHFQEILTELRKEEENEADSVSLTYLQWFLNCITTENFKDLLSLYERHSNPSFCAKLSMFVSEILQSSRSKNLLEALIGLPDVRSLGNLAYGMSFFNDVPVDIFYLKPELLQYIAETFGNFTVPIFHSLLAHYYVVLIGKMITKQPFLFVAINQFISETKKNLGYFLARNLQENSEFLEVILWKGLCSTSKQVFTVFLFAMIQLMNNEDSMLLTNVLKSNNVNLVHRLRDVAKRKGRYTHIQYGVKLLFSILKKDVWCDFAYSQYNTALVGQQNVIDYLFEDLVSPSITIATDEKKSSSPKHRLIYLPTTISPSNTTTSTGSSLGWSQFLSHLTLELFLSALIRIRTISPEVKKVPTRESLAFLLDDYVFSKILRHLITNVKTLDDSAEMLSFLLSELAKTHHLLNTITTSITVKNLDRKRGNLQLTLTSTDLQKIPLFIVDATRTDGCVSKSYQIKKNILNCLRYLMKCPAVFELAKKDTDFFPKMVLFCRDGNDFEFNRAAWKMFYQMIYYHYGLLEFWIKNNYLSPFLELVGTSSNNIIMINGLHFISKVFSMLTREQKKHLGGKQPTRNEKEALKSYEKDIKTFSSFFVHRSLFIKIHMIYKKLLPACSGAVFLELANFYHLLSTSPQCSKLLKDTSKKLEYRAGLTKIQMMFGSESSDQDNAMSSTSGMKLSPAVTKTKSSLNRTFALLGSGSKDKH